MKKIKLIIAAFVSCLILLLSCKKSSENTTPTITLALSNINFGTINTCTWLDGNNASHTGTPNNVTFTVSDPSGLLQSNTWQIYEQAGAQALTPIGSGTLNGTTLSFTGCITFGTNASIPANYYIVSKGITSNIVNATYNKPAGAL